MSEKSQPKLPDAEWPVPSDTEPTMSRGKFLKGAAVVAGGLLFGEALTPKPAKAEATGNLDPATYTEQYFLKMRDGLIPFGFFNGQVVIDNQARFYYFMDPNFTPYGKPHSAVMNYPSMYNTRQYSGTGDLDTYKKFGAGSRPLALVDLKNNIWLAFSMLSQNVISPSGQQQTEVEGQSNLGEVFFVPLDKENAEHVTLYSWSESQPFLAGAMAGYPGNFSVTTPGFEILEPSSLAAWDLANRTKNGYWNGGDKDWPVFRPLSEEKQYTRDGTGHPFPVYHMPSASKVKQLINQAHPGYGG